MIYRKFQITDKNGRPEGMNSVPSDILPQWAGNVAQTKSDWQVPHAPGESFFQPPIRFVIPPPRGSGEPFYGHNHCPAITWCDNGDILAAWFSTEREHGTEMTILASRLRAGADAWEPAAEFFKAPERNMTGTALFNDGNGTIYHFNGVGPEGVEGWENLLLLLRTSNDNGLNWTPPRAISSGNYQRRHQVIAGTSVTPGGLWIQPCDATPGGEGPSAIHISRDVGHTWFDPGGDIRGIHAGVVGLKNGRLLAFGRAQAIEDRMPISISDDTGKTWQYSASPFPRIHSGQRLVLMRLSEGPLLLVSFTDPEDMLAGEKRRGMEFVDKHGRAFTGYGMFAALSYDEGETWPQRKLITFGSGTYDAGGWTGTFTADANTAEPRGYLAATQSPDGVIHLISSGLHYRFNLSWLKH